MLSETRINDFEHVDICYLIMDQLGRAQSHQDLIFASLEFIVEFFLRFFTYDICQPTTQSLV